jgi:translation initiation factor IF-3
VTVDSSFGSLFAFSSRYYCGYNHVMTAKLRINEQIRISPVMVLDEDNQRLGVVAASEALDRARRTGLDLVEIEPEKRPPICRIMDYGKFAFEKIRASRHQSP